MPLSRSEIVEGFRWILGRDPDEAAIVAHSACSDGLALQSALLQTEEFRQHYTHLRPPSSVRDLALDQPRVVFLHIPKCGGTTLRETLAAAFSPPLICPERFNNLGDWALADLAGYRFFSGHFDYQSCRALPGENTKVVTLLREPRQRLLSLYYFLKAHRHEIAAGENLELALLARAQPPEEFFALPVVTENPFIRDAMVRALAASLPPGRWEQIGAWSTQTDPLRDAPDAMVSRAERALAAMAGFGLLEEFPRSLALISHALGLPLTSVVPRFVLDDVMYSSPRMEPVERRPVTAALEARLDALTRLDRTLYQRAQMLFDVQCGESGIAPSREDGSNQA